jgi:hypothetical protein
VKEVHHYRPAKPVKEAPIRRKIRETSTSQNYPKHP